MLMELSWAFGIRNRWPKARADIISSSITRIDLCPSKVIQIKNKALLSVVGAIKLISYQVPSTTLPRPDGRKAWPTVYPERCRTRRRRKGTAGAAVRQLLDPALATSPAAKIRKLKTALTL
jgi:hypothetical protein